MIMTYGLLWQRKYVHLGAGGNKGTLLGRHRSYDVVDFRGQIGIYELYDKDFVPVYVGQAGNGRATLFSRLKTHTRDHVWNRWEYFSWFGLRRVNPVNKKLSDYDRVSKKYAAPGSDVLNELEGVLIAAMEPKLNKQGPSFKDAQQFDQELDENVQNVTLSDIDAKIESLSVRVQKIAGKGKKKRGV